jgi:uncharacterized protein YndB with AHSA1/START domain
MINFNCFAGPKQPDPVSIYKSIQLNAKKEQVWSALTSAPELGQWWNKGVRLDPRVDGDFYEPWGQGQLATGKVLDVVPGIKIKFTWQEKTWAIDQSTICVFEIIEEDRRVVLRVTHSGWDVFGSTKLQMMEGFGKGWDFLLPKLKSYLE